MAHKMALMLALVAAALLHTVRTETTAPDTQDNHSNNGASVQPLSVLNLDYYLLQLNSKLDTLTSKMETLDLKMDTFDSKMETLNSKIETLDSKMETIKFSQENHTQQINALNSKLDTLTATTAQLSTEHQNLQTSISDMECTDSGQTMMQDSFPEGSFEHPTVSCKNIPSSNPSGHYWIQSTSTGSATMEYCHMSPPCSCTASSGWMRVAQLNMTDPNEHCPSGFRTNTSPKRLCSRPSGPGCASTTFTVNGVRYSKVCGKVIGYQFATMDAFQPYYNNRDVTLDNVYVDGVSLTHGQTPRQHIWTFVNALDEIQTDYVVCPCTQTLSTYTGVVPPFIDNDYFCETGSRYRYSRHWYTADPVWDGEGCGGTSTCCEFNSPPWFCKDLPQPTTDDIELRLCSDQGPSNEDTGLEIIEIYVQ